MALAPIAFIAAQSSGGGDRANGRIRARDSYDRGQRIYKLNIDHVYIADL
jgi:hypothetical protein